MKRREFIAGLAGGVACSVRAPMAQPMSRTVRVGLLFSMSESDDEAQARLSAFQDELLRLGWARGRNLHLDVRWAAGDPERLRAYGKDLVSLTPDVILTNGTPATRAVTDATSTIPVVFVNVIDPVVSGFVKSLSDPGGNVTGFTNYDPAGGKSVQVLKDLAPQVSRILLIVATGTGAADPRRIDDRFKAVAEAFGIQGHVARVSGADDITSAIEAFGRKPNGGLIVFPNPVTSVHSKLIVNLAAQHRLPAVYGFRFHVTNGGLMAYAVDTLEIYRQAASYVARILNGEKPGSLPVQQPTKLQLTINLRTARALGLEIPTALFALADEVIE